MHYYARVKKRHSKLTHILFSSVASLYDTVDTYGSPHNGNGVGINQQANCDHYPLVTAMLY